MKRLFILFSMLTTVLACDRSYVIVQVADAQLGFTAAVNGQQPGAVYVNDLTYEAEYLRKAVAKINEIKPDAVLFSGDQVNIVDNEEQWETFAEIISGLDGAIEQFHVPGNHDVLISEGNVDSTPFTSRYGQDHFISSHRGISIVGINTNLIKYNDPAESEQLDWLKSVLQKDKDSDVTLVFGHHPFFMIDIDEEDGYFQIQKAKRCQYFDVFKSMDVDAVYAGHRHSSSEGSYQGIPMKTTTSSAYQIGECQPSIRVIKVTDGEVSDEMMIL